MRRLVLLAGALLAGAGARAAPPPSPGAIPPARPVPAPPLPAPTGKPWIDMDYGPYLSASIEAPRPAGNLARKGILIRLGGDPEACVLFDTDLLRLGAAWTGGAIDWRGIALDGSHQTHPRIAGEQVFGNPVAPGWARPGSAPAPGGGEADFADPRPRGRDGKGYGPLPRAWARWRGLHLHGDRVVLSYTVGETPVLELAGVVRDGGLTAFARTLEIERSATDLVLQVAREDGARARVEPGAPPLAVLEPGSPRGGEAPGAGGGESVVAAGCATLPAGVSWEAAGPDLRLRLAAAATPVRLQLLIWRGTRRDLARFRALAARPAPAIELAPLTRGGPGRWRDDDDGDGVLVTRGKPGADGGAYAVDEITAPVNNPWRSWLRFGAFDFLDDGRRAAIATWSGDVWTVSGLDGAGLDAGGRDGGPGGGGFGRLEWRRIATGLFQPLGLKVTDGGIFVLGRDQITRLRDLDGDGETDFYENFNNDHDVTEHFHEFAMDLQIDAEGNFYYTKAGRHALDAVVPQHGTLIKVARDGSRSEIVAGGFRAPNGLCVNGDGSFIVSDQEGHWTPANRINRVRPGGFYGYRWSFHEGPAPTAHEPPLCWVPKGFDRSPAEQLWAASERWGPLSGRLLSLSYGRGEIHHVLHEQAGGVTQGGLVRLPLEFPTGIQRGRFSPLDGQLYVCGLFGWSSDKTQDGGFYRVRWTGRPLHLPERLHATRLGMVIGFTAPLDPAAALDPASYAIERWNYRWQERYGSDDYRLSDGSVGRDVVPVSGASLSRDGRAVLIRIADMRPCMQMEIRYRLRAAGGASLAQKVVNTIHALADGLPPDLDFGAGGAAAGAAGTAAGEAAPGETAPGEAMAELELLQRLAPGLALLFHHGAGEGSPVDGRRARLLALRVAAGAPPAAFLEAGAFTAEWRGFLRVDLAGEYTFRAERHGDLELEVNGGAALRGAVALRSGLNSVRARLRSDAGGVAVLRLFWSAEDLPEEPVPPAALWHDPERSGLEEFRDLNEGRRLFAVLRCSRCHADPAATGQARGMSELASDAPALEGIGSRLEEEWMARWIAAPRGLRADARMPQLLSGPTAAQEAADIAAYLASLQETGAAAETAGPAASARPVAPDGSVLFRALGCIACHAVESDGAGSDPRRPPLGNLREKWKPAALAAYLGKPDRHYRFTPMPDFRLSAAEAGALAAYLLAAGAEPSAPGDTAERTAGASAQRGDTARGRALAAAAGCAACHEGGPVGLANGLAAPSLETIRAGDLERGCLASSRVAGTRAPDFGLAPGELRALRRFLRAGPASLARRDLAGAAARAIETLRCAACHELDGAADVWSGLAAAGVAEPALAEAAAALGQRAWSDDQRRPALTWAGEKLRPAWMARLLGGDIAAKPRPGLLARMPAFPAHAGILARGLALEHGLGVEADEEPGPALDPARVAAGEALAGAERGFSCTTCHPRGGERAAGGAALETINLDQIAARLRPEFFHRFLLAPQRYAPGSQMPSFAGDDGRTPLAAFYGGVAQEQYEALWQYLRSLARPRAPVKTGSGRP